MRQVEISPDEVVIGEEVTVWAVNERGHKTTGQGGTVLAIEAEPFVFPFLTLPPAVMLGTRFYGDQVYTLADHVIVREVPFALDECIQYQEGVCHGNVDHFSPDGRGSAPLRCDYHIEQRIKSYENSIERYAHSDVVPAWFDPSAAGEWWDDD